MSIEEKASALRDKFNYLVKQYKKLEKKKSMGDEQCLVEAEEVKKQLALFFKENGSFIKTRKNSFGIFDYDNYVAYLRRSGYQDNLRSESSPNNFLSTSNGPVLNLSRSSNDISFDEGKDDKFYGDLYKDGSSINGFRSRMDWTKNVISEPYWTNDRLNHNDYLPPNRMGYKRMKYPMDPIKPELFSPTLPHAKQYHTDFVSGYYRKDPLPPFNGSKSPGMYLKTPTIDQGRLESSQPPSGVYEKYVNKKVTVYDFIKNSEEKDRQNDLLEEHNAFRGSNSSIPPLNNVYRTTPVLPQVNSIYNSSLYTTGPPPVRPIYRPIDQIYPSEVLKPVNSGLFVPSQPPLHAHAPNTPLWKNQFFQRETLKHQTKAPMGQHVLRTTNIKAHIKVNERKRSLDHISPVLSSSTSEDFQKYFLEDLLKETGRPRSIPGDTADFLYSVCDNFFEHVVLMSGCLATNGSRKTISNKDVRLVLKNEFNVELPEDSDVKVSEV